MQYYIVSGFNGLTLNVEYDCRKPILTNRTTGAEPDVWIKEPHDESSFKLKHENGNFTSLYVKIEYTNYTTLIYYKIYSQTAH